MLPRLNEAPPRVSCDSDGDASKVCAKDDDAGVAEVGSIGGASPLDLEGTIDAAFVAERGISSSSGSSQSERCRSGGGTEKPSSSTGYSLSAMSTQAGFTSAHPLADCPLRRPVLADRLDRLIPQLDGSSVAVAPPSCEGLGSTQH